MNFFKYSSYSLVFLIVTVLLLGSFSPAFSMRTTASSYAKDATNPQKPELPSEIEKELFKSSIELPSKLPFSGFVENKGQIEDPKILYYYSSAEMSVGFGNSKIIFVSRSQNDKSRTSFFLTFPEATRVTPVGKIMKSPSTNYFYGSLHLTNVPSWGEIWYYDLYPQIDLRYYMTTKGLKYEFIVRPGGIPEHITVKVNGAVILDVRAHTVTIKAHNIAEALTFYDTKLQVFQADKTPVSAHFILKDPLSQSYGFNIEDYDSNQPLIIDPELLWFSTYLGGSAVDRGFGIAVDDAENVYVTGFTHSYNFVTSNPYQGTIGGWADVFVTKMNSTGNGIVFSTFFGGLEYDYGEGIAVDTAGNVYVTGYTGSTDFPLLNAVDTTFEGLHEAFVFKLNATGNGLVFSTFLGGNDSLGVYSESGKRIAADDDENVYVAGYTDASNFPTHNAYQPSSNGGFEAFVTKLNSNGAFVFSTYLGGSSTDRGWDMALDSGGNCYVAGDTLSSDFPTQNAYNSTYGGGSEAFVTKLNSAGSLVYSTYLGGTYNDIGKAIAVDTAGNAYITGHTSSPNFPTLNAYQSSKIGIFDVFVTKLNAAGTGLVYSTYVGGSGYDYPNGIAVNSVGNCYITGDTDSSNFPTQNTTLTTKKGTRDAFVTILSTAGNGLEFSTYFGGTSNDYGYGIAVDSAGNCYITGDTWLSMDFPITPNAYQPTHKTGQSDAFVTKLTFENVLPIISSVTQAPLTNVTYYDTVNITADVTDDNGVKSVILYWSVEESQWNTIPMTGTPYQATLGPFAFNTTLRYYVQATDLANNMAVSPLGAPANYSEVKILGFSLEITTTPAASNITEGQLFYYDFNGSLIYYYDNGSSIYPTNLTWTLTGNGTSWLTINATSGELSGLPNRSHLGVWNITIMVEADDGESTVYTVFLTVNIMDIAPDLTTKPSSLNVTEITDFYYDFNASIAYPSNLTWTLAGNSTTWLTLNTSSGIITGTPNYSLIGVWNITITVIAEVGYSTNYTTFLTVEELGLRFAEVTPNQSPLLYDIILLQVRVETNTSIAMDDIEVDWWMDGAFLSTVTTNATGYSTYFLQLTSPGSHHVEVKAPVRGLQEDIYLITTDLEFWFNGEDVEPTPIYLNLGYNYTLNGQLVDDEGKPVPDVDLVYKLNDGILSSLRTDTNGWVNTTEFFLTAATITVTVLKDGMELTRNNSVTKLLIYVIASSPIVTVISPTTTMTEAVIGKAVSFVGWIYYNETPPIATAGVRVGLLVNGTQVDSQFSDSNGYLYFNYAFVDSGIYQVAFFYNERSWGEIWVTVTAGYYASWTGPATVNGTVGQAVEFTIYILANTSAFHRSIMLILNDGTPVIGAQVDWYINDAYQNSTLTGSDGRTSFSYIFATLGVYDVVAKHEGVILATFDVNIAEAPKEGLEKFVEENTALLTILGMLLLLFVVIGIVPQARRQVSKPLSKVKTLIGRKTVFGPRYCARTLTKELEEKFGREELQEAARDSAKQDAIKREVSAKLTRFPEFMTKTVDKKVEFTQKTTDLILKRYKK